MMLPTVTTASEIGINLARFGNSGSQPLLAPDTPKGLRPSLPPSLSPSLPGSPRLPPHLAGNDPPVWASGRAATAPSPASPRFVLFTSFFQGIGLFGRPEYALCGIHFICGARA